MITTVIIAAATIALFAVGLLCALRDGEKAEPPS
jgi:hypothetical protein